MPIREEAINVFMGLPGDGDRLELTYNHGVDSYELGTGYNHIALTVDDIEGTLTAAGRAGHRAREAPVSRARGRLADRVRPRSRRLPHRADREEPVARWERNSDSPSSTAGRTRSASSSSPTPTPGGSARTRSTRPCGSAKAWRAPARCSRSRWSGRWRPWSSTPTSARRPGSTRSARSPRRRSATRPTRRSSCRLARERSGLEVEVLPGPAEARYGYLAAVNSTTLRDGVVLDLGGGSMQLTRVVDRLADDARSWPLGAVRMTERFAPGQAASAPRRCARTSRPSCGARPGSATTAAWSRSAERSATWPRPPSSPPACPPTASRATSSRARRWAS